ncbi:MAG: hypothetical protein IJP03_00430, partial [Christensenellaceae bacterium]|nr:hypothetical protein [Christensenellaceae bacterium]
ARAEGEQTVFTFSFVKGSRSQGGESALHTVPEYTVKVLDAPRRLQISFKGMDHWEYDPAVLAYTDERVLGSLQKDPFGEQPLSLYVQLTGDAEYLVREKDAQLTVAIRPAEDEDAAEHYFVLIDAFEEYEEGLLSQELGLTPTLAAEEGAIRPAVISQAFASRADAEAFALKVEEAAAKAVPGKRAQICLVAPGCLPVISAAADEARIQRPVLKSGDTAQQLTLLMQNATYLCADSKGGSLFVRTVLPDKLVDAEPVTTDQIWHLQANGKKQLLDLGQTFYGIAQAEYSPDERYLAILDSSLDQSVVYVYDCQTAQMLNMAEEGFGSVTSSFVWDERDNCLYAMTGYDRMQLLKATFDDGKVAIREVEEQEGFEGTLALADGKLYFADQSAGDSGIIYRVDAITGKREEVSSGISFLMAPGGKTMVVCRPRPIVDEVQLVDVICLDLETGSETPILKNVLIEQMAYLADSSRVYITYAADDSEGEFAYGMDVFHVAQKSVETVGRLTTPTILTGEDKSRILVVDHVEFDGSYIPVTYSYTVK